MAHRNYNVRCVDGRLMRHDPQPDDPYLETDVGKCEECGGKGCVCECCGTALTRVRNGALFCKPCDDAREEGEAFADEHGLPFGVAP